MLYNALSMGMKTPKTVPSPWDFVILSVEDRDMAIGNMHKNSVKITHVVPEIFSRTDKQTHTHTYILTTILCNRLRGQSNKSMYNCHLSISVNRVV